LFVGNCCYDGGFYLFRKFYYHVVLGLVYRGKFGTLGLSRRSNLMDKPLEFASLNDLVQVLGALGGHIKKLHDLAKVLYTLHSEAILQICP
jgi:hypothetical protein